MATNFGAWPLRTMDIRSRYTVFGYIRRCENELFSLSSDIVYIPDEVYGIILIFYYFVRDYFASYGFDIATSLQDEISQNYMTQIINLGKTRSRYNTAYGHIFIDPFENKIHKWSFRIHRCNGDCFIGIDSSHKSSVNDKFIQSIYNSFGRWQNLQQFYAISSNGYKYSHYLNGKQIPSLNNNHINDIIDNDDDEFIVSGDKVIMILNFKQEYGTMSISINNDKFIKIFRMIPKSKLNPDYRLAVSLSVGSYIELLSYSYSANNDNLDLYKLQAD